MNSKAEDVTGARLVQVKGDVEYKVMHLLAAIGGVNAGNPREFAQMT